MRTNWCDWTGKSLAAFGIDETEEEARYRHAACLLADIGWRAHPEYRGTQSLNIIAHASFIGVDHPGRRFWRWPTISATKASSTTRSRRAEGACHAALSRARAAARRDAARRLSAVGLDARRHPAPEAGKSATAGRWRWSFRPILPVSTASGRRDGWRNSRRFRDASWNWSSTEAASAARHRATMRRRLQPPAPTSRRQWQSPSSAPADA